MTASIHFLPEELLVAIFTLILENEDIKIPHLRTTLVLVSKDWLRIVYDTPSLWTKIHDTHTDAQITLALVRSREAPLDIHCNSRRLGVWPSLDTPPDGRFVEVCHHLRRWRVARLHLTKETPWDGLIAPAPILEEVDITGPGEEQQPEHARLDLFQGHAPRLKSVYLKDIAISWSTVMFASLIKLQLEGLHMIVPTVEETIAILQASPQLEVLLLNLIRFQPAQAPPSPVRLPSLRTLELTGLEAAIMDHFLSAIHCPPCQRLVIDCPQFGQWDEPGDVSHLASLPRFLPPVSPDLGPAALRVAVSSVTYAFPPQHPHTCWIHVGYLPAEVILHYLVPRLPPAYLARETKLHLWYNGEMDDVRPSIDALDGMHITSVDASEFELEEGGIEHFLQQLGAMREGRWVLPALQELMLDFYGVSPGFLATMVKARYGIDRNDVDVPVPFTRLVIARADASHEADRDVVEAIVGDGCLVWNGTGFAEVGETVMQWHADESPLKLEWEGAVS